MAPESIHTHPEDGHWKFQVQGDLNSQSFKGKYIAKLEIPGGWEGSNQKAILGGGTCMDIS